MKKSEERWESDRERGKKSSTSGGVLKIEEGFLSEGVGVNLLNSSAGYLIGLRVEYQVTTSYPELCGSYPCRDHSGRIRRLGKGMGPDTRVESRRRIDPRHGTASWYKGREGRSLRV